MTGFKPGDQVFASVGLGFGAHAEYVCLSSKRAVTHMPKNMSYAAEDFCRTGETWDVIFDLVQKSSYSGTIAALNPKGRYILANPLFGSLLRARWTNWTSDKNVLTQFAASKLKDLVILKQLAEAGEIRAAIDRRYPLENAAEAHAYVDGGRRKGSVVLTMEDQEPKMPITEIL